MWKFPTKPWFQWGCFILGEGISEVMYQLHLNNDMYINNYQRRDWKIIEIIYQMVGKLLVAPWLPIFVRNMDIPNSLAPP